MGTADQTEVGHIRVKSDINCGTQWAQTSQDVFWACMFLPKISAHWDKIYFLCFVSSFASSKTQWHTPQDAFTPRKAAVKKPDGTAQFETSSRESLESKRPWHTHTHTRTHTHATHTHTHTQHTHTHATHTHTRNTQPHTHATHNHTPHTHTRNTQPHTHAPHTCMMDWGVHVVVCSAKSVMLHNGKVKSQPTVRIIV